MENSLNLHQRVVLITGPMSSVVSSIVFSLTRLGADCVLVDPDKTYSSAFTNQINDAREVNDRFGRAMLIQTELKTAESVKEAVAKAAQTFGGLDIFIDAFMIQKPTPMKFDGTIENFDDLIEKNLKLPMMFTQSVMAYLKNRKKGRVIYLLNETPASQNNEDVAGKFIRGGLFQFSQSLAKLAAEFNVTVNTLSISLTEEYILAHDPESKSIKEAMSKMKQKDSSLKITEPDKVSQTVTFLVSSMGGTLNGQNFILS